MMVQPQQTAGRRCSGGTRVPAVSYFNKAVLAVVSVLSALGVMGTKAGAVQDVPTRYIVTPQQFGAKADGVTDDTNAIQKAINTVFERGGGIVFFPAGCLYPRHAPRES